eukprot:TRINITY_DN63829_c0_g1_i1.p1 TRINITY_DN63829_c0_g1~~TRINITY_DN63829_c0_g1_i1.p1  ORF type:complete len:120 (-),score=17.04 TRINITY_DN63829_c0_g1_i1:52-411(-)
MRFATPPSYHFTMRRENSLFLKPMAVEGLSEGIIGGGGSGTAHCNILITDGSTYPHDSKGLLRYPGHDLPVLEGIKQGVPHQHLSPKVISNLLLSLIHISEPTRLLSISYAVFCLKKKK